MTSWQLEVPPARASDETWLGLRRRTHRAPDAGALHNMPKPRQTRPRKPTREKLESQARRPPGRRMLCGWRCGSGRQVPTTWTDEGGAEGEAWTPTRAADEMRLGLRRPAYRAQYARAPHSMP